MASMDTSNGWSWWLAVHQSVSSDDQCIEEQVMGKYSVLTQVDMGLRDELAGQLAAARRRILRHVWTISVVFFVATAALVAAAIVLIPPSTLQNLQRGIIPSGVGGGDFLKLFIPILTLVVGFVAGALWLKRPERSGSGVAEMRNSLASQMLEERKLSSSEREAFRKEVEERIRDIRQNIQTLTDRYAAEAVESRARRLEERLSQFTTEAEDIISKVEARLEPYKWLQERKGELDYLVGVFTMGAAAERVARFFSEKKMDLAVGVAKYAIDEKLSGAVSAYRALAAELARHAQEPLAVQVVDLGLSRFPADVDLLADGIKYATSVGDMTGAEDLYGRLRRVDYSKWNGRGFALAGDYLEAADRAEEALALYGTFRQQTPDDERGYIRAGLLLRRMGKHDEAIEVLEAGAAACRRCAQIAFALSEIYMQRGDYTKAILMANRASESTADEQASVDQAAITWNRAIAEDSLIHKMLDGQKTKPTKAKLLDLARHAVLDYKTSVKMMEALPAFKVRADERQVVLRNLLAKAGVDEEQMHKVFGRNGSNGEALEASEAPAPDSEGKAEEAPVKESSQPA
jgi:tetratricopeptide (TPR) repeat protein